jgi:membrane-bound ClpP family serine protease
MLRSLAQLRGRDAEFAREAVVDAATLTGEEALKRGVIEIVANNVDELIAALDGRTVKRRRQGPHAQYQRGDPHRPRTGLAHATAR